MIDRFAATPVSWKTSTPARRAALWQYQEGAQHKPELVFATAGLSP
jgi:hypothetical protein